MNVIRINVYSLPPDDYTGKVVYFEDEGCSYYYNGLLHRADGPADIFPKHYQNPRIYWLYGENFDKTEWFERLTDEEKVMALMNPENFEGQDYGLE